MSSKDASASFIPDDGLRGKKVRTLKDQFGTDSHDSTLHILILIS